MATRAAAFTAKIRNLKDYQYRMVNNVTPVPSGIDIANTLKHFSQTLLSVLKDVPIVPKESYGPRQKDSVRLSVFPNLNYSGLYEAVIAMIDAVPLVQIGQHDLGGSILNVIGCLVPFLEYDLLDTLPYTVATTLAVFPASLHTDIVQLLCTNLLPITLGYEDMNEHPCYASDSTSAIIMLVFQYIENTGYHSQVVECIMQFKKNVCKDLLSVIAFGPPKAKPSAANHLFHYWPQLNPTLTDRRSVHYKYNAFEFIAWDPILCQRDECPNRTKPRASKMCLDPTLSIACGERPPPIYLCVDCVDMLPRDHRKYMVDVLKPSYTVSLKCENKNCASPRNEAVCTCFSLGCACLNGFRPVRYCRACHQLKHTQGNLSRHVYHVTLPDVWSCDPDIRSYLVEAIVSLLKEAQALEDKRTVEMGEERLRGAQNLEQEEEETEEGLLERRLLSRYGVWLLVQLCPPGRDNIQIEVLGRLLAMLFQWFDSTAYLPDDHVGNALERLKPQYVCNWLKDIAKTHFEVILACLLPHPIEYARVGGHWDTLSSRTVQIKEGLNRMCCLIPYNIVSFEVWDYIIPFWLEAIRTEVPEDDKPELKVLLKKMFDTDLSPLPFSVEKMYNFLAVRFENASEIVQEQNLFWMKILTNLEVIIPMELFLRMCSSGVRSLNDNTSPTIGNAHTPLQSVAPPNVPADNIPPGSPLSPTYIHQMSGNAERATVFTFDVQEVDEDEDGETRVTNITCFIMMLDIVLKQTQLQSPIAHEGPHSAVNGQLLTLLTDMLRTPWRGAHTCVSTEESEKTGADPPTTPTANSNKSSASCPLCRLGTQWGHLAAKLLEFVSPQEEIAIPEKGLPHVDELQKGQRPRSHMTAHVGGVHETLERTDEEEEDSVTSQAQFDVTSLPAHLQLLHALLKAIEECTDADCLLQFLTALKYLCLHMDCLNEALPKYQTAVRHLIRVLIVPNLWRLLCADQSHVAWMGVPLLLHCLTLPSGPDVFWRLVEGDFNNDDWRARFAAVEKVTVIARMLKPETIRKNQQIMTSLSHAFCCLIGSLNDINSKVIQRTTIYLETIKGAAVKCMCYCLEFQFDSVIKDRTMILQKMYLLSVILRDNPILTWEFFLNRFDTLCLEAQLDLESTGDIACLQDLESSDKQSDTFLKKLNRARFALARTESVRSVSGSVYAKVPYRRAASVPMHLLAKTIPNHQQLKAPVEKPEASGFKQFIQHLTHLSEEKEKSLYKRQQSAPQFRNRGSRFGLAIFGNYMFPGGNLREFTDEESNFAALLQRAMDLDGVDRETVHQLVTLLVKFMVYCDQERVNEDRVQSRAQNIVLRHINVLLGYNQTEKAFSVPPYKLRYSAVFNAFISALPHVLDKNFSLGNMILPVSMALLQYCASPQRYASDYQPPNFSLWLLEPHVRVCWLRALLVILYKYQYNTAPAAEIMQTLVRLAVNTVDAQVHRCKTTDDAAFNGLPTPPLFTRNRSRDTSNMSTNDLDNIAETATPPEQSPLGSPDVDTVAFKTGTSCNSVSALYSKQDSLARNDNTRSLANGNKANAVVKDTVLNMGRPNSSEFVHMRANKQESAQSEPQGKPQDGAGAQSRRIAEYNRNSWILMDDDGEIKVSLQEPVEEQGMSTVHTHSAAGTFSTSTASTLGNKQPPIVIIDSHDTPNSLLSERLNPPLPSSLPQSRTLEQSAEEFVSRQYRRPVFTNGDGSPIARPANSSKPSAQSPQDTIDQKITEQIHEFESQGSLRTHGLEMSSDLPMTSSWDKPSLLRLMTPLLEEVKEAEEETVLSQDQSNDSATEASDSAIAEWAEGLPRLEKQDESTPASGGTYEIPAVTLSSAHGSQPHYRQRKARKSGLSPLELSRTVPELGELSSSSSTSTRKSRRSEMLSKISQNSQKNLGPMKIPTEQLLVERCQQCSAVLEQYDEETISLSIVCQATLIHREPALAAPLLLDMMYAASRIASSTLYPWQSEKPKLFVPGNAVSVARQFIRCTLHHLAPNGIFTQLFMTDMEDPDMLKTIAHALVDFSDLNCVMALQVLLEGVNETRSISPEQMTRVVTNLATYLDYISLDSGGGATAPCGAILAQFDIFLRRWTTNFMATSYISPVLKIITNILTMPGIAAAKMILEPVCKIVSHAVQNCSFKLQQIIDMCAICVRVFTKERDKLQLTRTVVFELTQAMKFKTILPDENLLLLVQFVCVDAGGTLGPTNIVQELCERNLEALVHEQSTTNAAESLRPHLAECVEFIADLHTINKVKCNMKSGSDNLNEDTLGSLLKAGIAQYVALEFTKGSSRDNRAITRYLPWLYHPPSAMQQGPREFIDRVGHIRLLSWLLLGSLTHTAITRGSASVVCFPLALECSAHISDHVMVIMTGFAEQSKASVLHMSSLFHAFILCQLWTMYCESVAAQQTADSEAYLNAHTTVMDFWGRVTPGVLQLLSHSQVLAEMVNLHFLSLMEALQECNSTVLCKLFSMWTPILYSYHNQLPGHVQVRLQMCQNWEPKLAANRTDSTQIDSVVLLKWLKRVQFKLGQIEVQSSAATQFYTV